ncbi:MAG: hypothetical protein IJS14_01380 [Lentisphaeria bacterium]|nr:hypothetical protein [Lentisphaeria bacterium]
MKTVSKPHGMTEAMQPRFTLIELLVNPACFTCVSSRNMRYEIGNMK